MIQSGAGFNLAGQGFAGQDDLTFTIAAPLPPLPAATNYDASIKAFTQNDDGTFAQIDPIDQMVEMLLTIPQGTVAAVSGIGARYAKRLLGIPTAQQNSVALDETNVALAALIKAGDITIQSVAVNSVAPGSNAVYVVYKNNRASVQTANQAYPTVTIPLFNG